MFMGVPYEKEENLRPVQVKGYSVEKIVVGYGGELRDECSMRKQTVGLRLRVWVITPNGKRKLVRNRWSRSFVQQWIDILYGHFRNTTSGFTVKRTDGTTAGNYYPHSIDTRWTAYYNSDLFGIVVGAGNNPVAVSDYKLQSQIMHGTTAGKIYHGTCVGGLPYVEETSRKMIEFNRVFSNMTDYDIVVREVGVYAQERQNYWYYCFVRDAIGPITVPAKGGIAVSYGFELTL